MIYGKIDDAHALSIVEDMDFDSEAAKFSNADVLRELKKLLKKNSDGD
jgi:hypothetical protein